ncbi:hypothetical protein DTL42_01050 [Bremerella cremea]|uniref:Uncharacterized protein n=1 Tax=Bremerella cremea TaxID=1031537 RepID=A0A368KXE7_9BACT|nr:hypothetical protein [Bremerella cremea]RCS56005.1 hypothetical protein DTL42_01050 [Bremerella cremea]
MDTLIETSEDNPFESPATPSESAIIEVSFSPFVTLTWILPLLSGLLSVTAFIVPAHIGDTPIAIWFFAASLLSLIGGIGVTIYALFVGKQWAPAWPHLLAGILLSGVMLFPLGFFVYALIAVMMFLSSFS